MWETMLFVAMVKLVKNREWYLMYTEDNLIYFSKFRVAVNLVKLKRENQK